MKKAKLFFAIGVVIILGGISLLGYAKFFAPKTSQECHLNVPHVRDQMRDLRIKYHVGGFCYVAALTSLIKMYDPNVTFWDVLNYMGITTDFSIFKIKGIEGIGATDGLGPPDIIMGAKNLGYIPHLAIRDSAFIQDERRKKHAEMWESCAEEIGLPVEVFTKEDEANYWNKIKKKVASGYPVLIDNATYFHDFNIIEGFCGNKLYILIPNPEDIQREDPRIVRESGPFVADVVFWITPGGKKKTDIEVLGMLKTHAASSIMNMRAFAYLIRRGKKIHTFDAGRFYILRIALVKFLIKHKMERIASLYQESAEEFLEICTITEPMFANKHRYEIAQKLIEISNLEEEAFYYWSDKQFEMKNVK